MTSQQWTDKTTEQFLKNHGMQVRRTETGALEVLEILCYLENGESYCTEEWINASGWTPLDVRKWLGY